MFDYSIRLNHTWAFSGFPDVKSIMDINGPYLNDLQLGVNVIPIMQYGFSGFLTVWPHYTPQKFYWLIDDVHNYLDGSKFSLNT